ncbi:low molecular weight protein-tyrosine-phosphatase [Thioalkalivibrio sp. XN279]|uniref:low molecular weight protein-tyrosine-phosphatase n=1 Tax=Thioalkalivibrio sp. XN279 TaxID=2714953 RepID=UPI00140A0DC3|nr:low molecular weight protein-tyrosine-phosphatase [Thioalkalivibrio sp. XN279]NHA14292.1 low molecular weight phosphotyrosine protein phosphatase [Thioalkalivibrio sp. XN279]
MDRPEHSVLFVCLGNICRSPTAEGVFRHLAREAGLEERIRIDSAGTGGYHIGAPPDARAMAAAQARGYDLAAIRARKIAPEDFEQFNLILAMDEDNLVHLRGIAPETSRARLGLLLDYAPGRQEREVPDPYYGGRNGFEQVLDLVNEACAGLLEELRRNLP